MPPIRIRLNLTYGSGGDSFKEFQDGRHGIHLGYQNGTILAILNLCVTVMPPVKFWLTVWEVMSFEDFQDLGYRNGTILTIPNLHVATMPPAKFQFNSTYGSGGDVKNLATNGWTDRRTDGRTTGNRQGHTLTLSKAPGELKYGVCVHENVWLV